MMKTGDFSPIGVFDSGFGGLEILRELVSLLPEYDFLYLGDTARNPYGTRSQEVIYQFTEQAVDYLFEQNCPLIVLACNTVSSRALRKIQQDYLPKNFPTRRVLGVVIPACEEAVGITKNNKIGVIGTEGTVESDVFVRELIKLNSKVEVFQQACPLLVSIVESGEDENQVADIALKNYFAPLVRKGIDTLILGCTHYGILEKKIGQVVGKKMRLIIEGKVVANKLQKYLERHPEIKSQLSVKSRVRFLTTDLSEKFEILGSRFFGRPICPENATLK